MNWAFALQGNIKKLQKLAKYTNDRIVPDCKKIKRSIEKDKELMSQCDKIICISQHAYRFIRDVYKIDTNKLVLINNGIKDVYMKHSRPKRNYMREKYHIGANEKVILFVGRIDEAKGISVLIKAFGKLLHTHTNIRLIIVGDGHFAPFIKSAKDICAKVTFTGKLPQKEVYRFYCIADIGVQPSVHEMFGYVAIEMMMHELPVIVTNTGGLAEIIDDGINGLKVPLKTVKGNRLPDVKALYDRLKYLLEHPCEAQRLGKNARNKFLDKYELSIWSEKMLQLYNELLNQDKTA
jgi:glycosyltransferase